MNSILTSPRHFNDIRDCGPYLIKSSIHFQKISAEINFYENISDDLKRFYPQYLGKTKDGKWPAGYKIEKIPNYDLGVYFTQKNKGGDYSFEDIFTALSNVLCVEQLLLQVVQFVRAPTATMTIDAVNCY